jgi:hypothetical protein
MEMETATKVKIIIILCIGMLLLVILLPLSFSYIEYYEYGLLKHRTTGSVDTSQVYSNGRYMVGVTQEFLKYQSDAHHEELDLSVFSSGDGLDSVGLAFDIHIDLTYVLKKDEIGELHKDLASTYRSVIVSRATEAIKNEAIYISFNDYFSKREGVENRFRVAVENGWQAKPSVHCELDQFHLGRINIPEKVANKQLDSRIQTENNDKEAYLQKAEIERQKTAVEVNSIMIESDNVIRTAEAEAKLVTSRATAEAKRIEAEAEVNGTKSLFYAAGINEENHRTTFMYIRTLLNRENLKLDISYLFPDSVLMTKSM